MSATNQELVKAAGKVAPQFFNKTEDGYQHLEGFAGAAFYMLRGSMVIDYVSGSATVTKNYDEPVYGFALANDGEDDVSINFGGMTILVKPGETFDDHFKVGNTSLTVNATTAYRMVVRV